MNNALLRAAIVAALSGLAAAPLLAADAELEHTPPLGVQVGQDLDVFALRTQFSF